MEKERDFVEVVRCRKCPCFCPHAENTAYGDCRRYEDPLNGNPPPVIVHENDYCSRSPVIETKGDDA